MEPRNNARALRAFTSCAYCKRDGILFHPNSRNAHLRQTAGGMSTQAAPQGPGGGERDNLHARDRFPGGSPAAPAAPLPVG